MLLVLPVIVPLLTAVITVLLWRNRAAQRMVSAAGAVILLVVALVLLDRVSREGIVVAQIGNWPAPYGISFVADLFSALMVAVTGLMALAVAIYSLASMDAQRESFGYYPLLHLLLMGVCGAFLTGDIFNLFVWYEVMLMSSFVLTALGGERAQLEGAIKYVTLNLMASTLFLVAVGLLYGTVGTLNMADLAQRIGNDGIGTGMITTLSMLFLVAFGIKAAVFPLFAWLPAAYHTPPIAVSALFAGLLTKVGVYSLIRVFTLIFVADPGFTHTVILVIAGLTMVTGVLGAVAQNEFRRILSFHIVSQIGYMLMGLGLYTPLALAGSVFYIVHHIVVKTNLFLVSGVVQRLRGTYELKDLGGVYRLYPLVSVLFLIPAFSLAGVPPLSGFWSKLLLVQAGLEIEQYLIVGVSLLVSVLTLFSMTKIWTEAFWKEPPREVNDLPKNGSALMLAPIALLAIVTLTIGFVAEPFFAISQRAAEQLLDPAVYVQAVLDERALASANK